MKMMRNHAFSVVIVCTGNIIRSPYAASLLQARSEMVLPGRVVVASAGTEAREGRPVEARTLDSLARHGIDVPTTRSTRLRTRTLTQSDLVLGASVEHVTYAMTMSPSILHRTFTLTGLAAILKDMPTDFVREAGNPVESMRAIIRRAAFHRSLGMGAKDIMDPYGQSDAVHAVMVDQVEGAVAGVADGLFTAVRRP